MSGTSVPTFTATAMPPGSKPSPTSSPTHLWHGLTSLPTIPVPQPALTEKKGVLSVTLTSRQPVRMLHTLLVITPIMMVSCLTEISTTANPASFLFAIERILITVIRTTPQPSVATSATMELLPHRTTITTSSALCVTTWVTLTELLSKVMQKLQTSACT